MGGIRFGPTASPVAITDCHPSRRTAASPRSHGEAALTTPASASGTWAEGEDPNTPGVPPSVESCLPGAHRERRAAQQRCYSSVHPRVGSRSGSNHLGRRRRWREDILVSRTRRSRYSRPGGPSKNRRARASATKPGSPRVGTSNQRKLGRYMCNRQERGDSPLPFFWRDTHGDLDGRTL
jgi:hypothetical protein